VFHKKKSGRRNLFFSTRPNCRFQFEWKRRLISRKSKLSAAVEHFYFRSRTLCHIPREMNAHVVLTDANDFLRQRFLRKYRAQEFQRKTERERGRRHLFLARHQLFK